MKNKYSFNLIVVIIAQLILSASFISCSDDNDDETNTQPVVDKTEIYMERLNTLVANITSLRDGATYGEKEGNYPVSSKAILDDQIVYLNETISKIQEGIKKLLDSEMDRIILETNQIEKKFKATIRSEDFLPLDAELQITGKNGGYIDFGSHPEYSAFGDSGKQAFTVEFWVKLTDVDNFLNGFYSLLSTFTDDDTNDHERKGWFVNSHFGRMRMSYGIGFNDLFEPGFSFSTVNQWVHIALVTDENGVDGEFNGNIPIMTKIYINGELQLSERGRDDKLPYTSNDKNVPMVAFTQMSVTGNRVADKSTNGMMKHLHIWKSAKNQSQIREIMNNPATISGTEPDLVCGWTLDKTVADNNNIVDITGKFYARLVGDFLWITK